MYKKKKNISQNLMEQIFLKTFYAVTDLIIQNLYI